MRAGGRGPQRRQLSEGGSAQRRIHWYVHPARRDIFQMLHLFRARCGLLDLGVSRNFVVKLVDAKLAESEPLRVAPSDGRGHHRPDPEPHHCPALSETLTGGCGGAEASPCRRRSCPLLLPLFTPPLKLHAASELRRQAPVRDGV